MESIERCPICVCDDSCWRIKAKNIKKSHMLPEEKNKKLAENFQAAKADNCGEVNSDEFNPNFKGKEKL